MILQLLLELESYTFLNYSSNLISSAMKYDFYPYRNLVNKYDLKPNIYFQYAHDIFYNSQNNDLGYFTQELKHDVVGDLSFFIFIKIKAMVINPAAANDIFKKSISLEFR